MASIPQRANRTTKETAQLKKTVPLVSKRSLSTQWTDYWFGRVPGHSLAAFRILFGIYLLFLFLRYAAHASLSFSNVGVYSPFLIRDPLFSPFWAGSIYGFTILVLVGFTSGYRTRLLTPLALLLYLYHYFLNFAVTNSSFDRLNLIFLFLLCFAELDRVWAFRTTRSSNSEERSISVWPIRMLTLQLSLLYFGAGLWKLLNPSWHSGEMMRWTMAGPWASPLSFWLCKLEPPHVVFDVLTWGTILLELVIPFLLLNRRSRLWAVVAGSSFHLAVALVLNIPEFLNCVTVYVLVYSPEEVKKLGERFLSRVSRFFYSSVESSSVARPR